MQIVYNFDAPSENGLLSLGTYQILNLDLKIMNHLSVLLLSFLIVTGCSKNQNIKNQSKPKGQTSSFSPQWHCLKLCPLARKEYCLL